MACFFSVSYDLKATAIVACLILSGCAPPSNDLIAELLDNDTPGEKRQLVAWELGESGELDAFGPLLTIVNDRSENRHLRSRAAHSLALLATRDTRDVIMRLFTDRNEDALVRQSLVRGAALNKNVRFTDLLILATKDDNEEVVFQGFDSLSGTEDPVGVEHLIKSLEAKDGDRHLRNAKATALASCSHRRAIERSIQFLRDDTELPYIRARVAARLALSETPAAVGAAFRALKDENSEVRQLTFQQLESITENMRCPAFTEYWVRVRDDEAMEPKFREAAKRLIAHPNTYDPYDDFR